MDLSVIEDKLQSDVYLSPVDFCKDVRLIFNNSKKYNTKKKSKVSEEKLLELCHHFHFSYLSCFGKITIGK